jgi:hypothetical protein
MAHTAKPTRENRTITVDFHDEATYFALLSDGKAFVEFVLAFILSLGFQLTHKSTCNGGSGLTRHSHYARVRLGGLSIWRIQCTSCKAVFTVLPHFILWHNTGFYVQTPLVQPSLFVQSPMEAEAVQMHVTPGKDDLEGSMESGKGRVAADEEPAPYQRANTLRDHAELIGG